MSNNEFDFIIAARRIGVTWENIGTCLNVHAEAVRSAFRREINKDQVPSITWITQEKVQ